MAKQNRIMMSATPQWLVDWIKDPDSASGVHVTAATAMSIAAVWQAVNVISGDVGSLPLVKYQRGPEGRTRSPLTDPAARVTRRRPNGAMNAATFREVIQSHALLWGNGRAGIVRDQLGRPVMLVPFLPEYSREEVVDGELYHVTRIDGEEKWYHTRDVLHIKGLSHDGVTGYSVVSMARRSLGGAISAETHGVRFFRNNARPSVVLESLHSFDEEDARRLLADWDHMHSGVDNAGRTALLPPGVKATLLSMSNEDAQFLETRKFQRSEIASWFCLPPHKVGDDARVSYNSLEQENQAYINQTLMRWLVHWQEECCEKLLTTSEKLADDAYFEFATESLLRGDTGSRYSAYAIGLTNRFLSPNEVREKENMRRYPGGDSFANPNIDTRPQSPPAEGDTAKKLHEARRARLAEMIEIEAKRVRAASAEPDRFLAWLDAYYERWKARVAKVMASIDAPAALADEHCRRQHARLLDVAGAAKPDTLAAMVAVESATWDVVIDDLLDLIEESNG